MSKKKPAKGNRVLPKPRKPGPNRLPITPWWHHPNHNYRGRHRGKYQHVNPASAMFFGVRSIMVRPYHNVENFLGKDLPKGFTAVGFDYSTVANDSEIVVAVEGDNKEIKVY